jgi:hypothetical protein
MDLVKNQQTVQSQRVWNFNNSNTTVFIHSYGNRVKFDFHINLI